MSEIDLEPYVSEISVQMVALLLAMREHRADIRWKRVARKLARTHRVVGDFVESKGSRRRIDKAATKLVAFGNEFAMLNKLVREDHIQLAVEIINSKVSKSE